jgi:transglutaminase-like putative cysteine protease
MQLTIEHRTHYRYSEPVNYTIQQLRLTPVDGYGQRVWHWDIRVHADLHRFLDAHGNTTHTLVLDKPHDEISIVACGEVETGLPYDAGHQRLPLEVYLRRTELTGMDTELRRFADRFARYVEDAGDAWLDALMHAIVERVPYVRGNTMVNTTAADAFRLGAGVCQDHAHIFIACCRYLGLPARYVSGYLFTQDGRLMESHAWADVYLRDGGWRSLDVSNGCRTNGVHVRLATGLDYRDACPVSGVRVGGGTESMGVSVLVNQAGQMQQAQQQ